MQLKQTSLMSAVPPNDRLGRPLRALRISVTDRCNLRCRYCLPSELFGPDFRFLPRSEILSFEEISRIAQAFVALGVEKIRITGGEPLLRKDLPELIKQLRQLDDSLDIAMTTNGSSLGKMAAALRQAGLNRVNVSLDALDANVAATMAGRPVDPESVWQQILQARSAGLGLKVNTVLKRGINEDQVIPLAKRCRDEGISLRFIEFMDVGHSNAWKKDAVVTGGEILDKISSHWKVLPIDNPPGGETARSYRYIDGSAEVGFINSISEPFCQGCGRARISAEGMLYTCLFSSNGVSLKSWIRDEQMDQDTLMARIAKLWGGRNDRYSELREKEQQSQPETRPEMWTVGG